MIGNTLYIGDIANPLFTFDDTSIRSVNGSLAVDLIANELSVDELTPVVEWDKIGENVQVFAPADYDAIMDDDGLFFATSYTGDEDLLSVPYGTPVWFYFDDLLRGKYYVKKIIRQGRDTYQLTLMSPIGLLDTIIDYGGMYSASSGDTFRSVLADILDGTVGPVENGLYPITGGVFDCYVEQSVGVLPIAGWLPIATKRENLHQLLFSENVSLTKASDGTPVFAYLYNQVTPSAIPESNIRIGGQVNYEDKVTAVELTEHTYLDLGASDELVTLFDGSAEGTVTNAKVLFTDPIHGDPMTGELVVTGSLTVSKWGANYAIVSGNGILQGYKYTHSTKVLRRDIAQTGTTNEVAINRVTLVNPLNSVNVADRLAAFYSTAVTVDADIYIDENDEPRCGRQYTFTDPFGEEKTGFIARMDFNVSETLLANSHIVTDYAPTGQGNNYSSAVLISSGNWTVPDGVTKARIILIAGGAGGSAGSNGADGGRATLTNYSQTYYHGFDMSTAIGGAGGAGGAGGSAGKILTVDLDPVTPGDVITISYGTGGAADSPGTDTVITYNGVQYTTADGTFMPNGIVNLFTGEILGRPGRAGIKGGDGGAYLNNGENVTGYGQTWQGGSHSQVSARDGDHYSVYGADATRAGGGGAAYGRNGSAGRPLHTSDYNCDGGAGASALPPPQADYGCGGNGGNGGGGGGGGSVRYFSLNSSFTAGNGGAGGSGSAGGQGGDGCVLIYY